MSEFAGTLRERITIERTAGARTPEGLPQSIWETVCSCLASIAPDGVGAESEAQALSAMPRCRITIRWRDGLAIGQRVKWRGMVLMIRQLIEDPRTRDRVELRCEEVRQ